MANEAKVSPLERAQIFAKNTRQNMHSLGKKTAGEGERMTFTLPKARLLSRVLLKCDVSYKVKNASTFNVENAGIYIEKVVMNLNNGFDPFSISGKELVLLNRISSLHGDLFMNHNVPQHPSEATEVTHTFFLSMQNAVNDRDTVGLILLQNDTTYAEINIDIANNVKSLLGLGSSDTISDFKVTVTPTLETFTIPTTGLPDLSVLKLVHSRKQAFASGGVQELKMPTGTIYRRIILDFGDDINKITGNIDLVFNQVDRNYSIDLATLGHIEMERNLFRAKGVIVFDFTYQGVPNLGGTRDYIDSEKLTEFSIVFNSTDAGTVTITTETLARLA